MHKLKWTEKTLENRDGAVILETGNNKNNNMLLN